MMDEGQGIEGSVWFNAGEGQDMADMAAAGTVDLSIFEHVSHPLDKVNDAISGIAVRNGGFSNFVIAP
jgi:alcohol dehydrogenase